MTTAAKTLFLVLGVLGALSTFPASTHAQGKKPPVDTSHLDVPLEDQIEARVESRLAAKLKDKTTSGARYFLTMYSYQNDKNNSAASHTFATYTRVGSDGSRKTVTISWLPVSFKKTKQICTFEGFWSAVNPSANHCEREAGFNASLDETIAYAAQFGRNVGVWGPYETKKDLFEHAVARVAFLKSGAIDYIADDRLTRPAGTAINCLHAISDFAGTQVSLGGLMGKGMWGFKGTQHILKHYELYKAYWLVDSIDEKVFDRFVFVK